MQRLLVAVSTLPMILAGLFVVAPTAPANAAGDLVKVRLLRAIKNLDLAQETRRGYDRDKFRHWVDADGDCRDARDEVLAAESLVSVHGCDVQVGKWRSYYDRKVVRYSTNLDIDHMVPLAEAWDSGAKRWNAGTRMRFANDLVDSRALVAVTASSNRSKSDRDPSDWMPAYGRCKYIRQWVAVKTRWSLKVNLSEKRALAARADGCANVILKVRKATIRTGPASGGAGGGGGGGGTGGGTDPRFDYCYQAVEAGYGPYYRGADTEYAWYTDSDSDGVVCES